ncbi:hypothetical protein KVG88_21250 [Pseudomonas sp. SWRI74]|uniref:Uncharacterized protein n=1 Tax=Pseudomonas azerbaijanoccidentalis TaxID=2842347 RepID=A0ABS6QUJ3_9PSED|nr:hypothetical protein [Pseudomonas azerbaijanoccidentalis]MBV4522596.1 hypothetical protein [Pseudomonas azerbaijanoccidentalis]
MKTLRAESGGKSRLVGMWKFPEAGPFADLYAVAREARNHVEGLQIAAMGIINDARRSDSAKQEDIRATAKDRLYLLGQLQRDFEKYKEKVKERADKVTAVKPYRDNDPIAVQIDLALAAQLRAMSPPERNATLLAGTDKAYVDAALRLPRELSGVSSEWYARITKEALVRANPREAQEIADLTEAADAAQDALRTAFGLISADAGISLDERVDAAGEAAKELVQGPAESTIERIQERLERVKQEEEESDEALKKQIQGEGA